MKKIVILADGLADEPIKELGNKTPVMAANTPNIDKLCEISSTGLLQSVPDSLPPGSEVANMTIIGYDAEKYYQGRGVLEAAALGIDVDDEDMVMRCNLITTEGDTLVNHSAGHISTKEAGQLIDSLNKKLGDDMIQLYTGVSYRHVLVIKGVRDDKLYCTPPHDIPGKKFESYLPKEGDGSFVSELLKKIMFQSKEVLENHPVNVERAGKGEPVANMIWPWSPGHRPAMPSLREMYGIKSGAVISAVDLIHGIARFAGLKSISVDGATGLYDTNYSGKADAAIEAMKENDYLFLHIEAPDEAGHEGDVKLKIKTIEDIDKYVVAKVLDYALNSSEPVSVAFLPDHPTPCEKRTHTRSLVPFAIYKPGQEPDRVKEFNEYSVEKGSLGSIYGTEFMELLIG